MLTPVTNANSALLNVGGVLACVPLPGEGAVYEEFYGIQAVIGTTTITAGAINAFLTLNPVGWRAYAEGKN